ncbi:MAG: trigger factor [Christensenellales bacterium]
MKYEKKILDDKRIEVKLNVSKEEWDSALEHAYEANKGKYAVQGFRKGHTPRKVIEKTYGDTVFYDDAIDDCFYRYYFEMLSKEKDIKPVSAPEVNISKIDENGLELIVRITQEPEVSLGDYKGITIEKKEIKVSASEVNHELEHMKEHRAKFVSVDREIKNGDTATINFVGSIDGKKFDGGSAEDFDLEIGSKSFIDNFEDQLVGLKKGDKKDVNVTFPENYHVDDLKGKPAVFAVEVKDVKEKQYPEIDDKFADEVSEFSTLKELKEDIKKKLVERKTREEQNEAESKLIDKICDNAKVEIPQVMIDNQVEDFIKDFERRLSYQGLNLDGYLKYTGITLDDLRKSRVEDAKKTVKTRLVLTAIMEKENIDVTEQEIADKFNEGTKDKPKTIEEIQKTLGPDQYNYMANSLLLNKLMKFLKENNTL